MSGESNGPVLVVLAAGRATRFGGVKPLAPVGIAGEPVLDLLCADARRAGFRTFVIVVGPTTGPAIRYHVERTWPSDVDVRFAIQEVPLGTVSAVLASTDHLAEGVSFGVANADDLYGSEGLGLLAAHVGKKGDTHAVVAYRLRQTVVGTMPVTRGICAVGPDSTLTSVTERRLLAPNGNGGFTSEDGLTPSEFTGDEFVSVNLWGFGPAMQEVLVRAMDGDPHASNEAEVLLPDVVGSSIGKVGDFMVLATETRCVGVTHRDDMTFVRREIAREVGMGTRPAACWGGPA